MRHQVPLALLPFVSAGLIAVASAQQPAPPTPPSPTPPSAGQPAPPRPPARGIRPGETPQKGTATLRGFVVAADTGNPLRRATVRASSQAGPSNAVTTTDAQGRFEIKELLAGRYAVTANKAGYVTMSFGQRRAEQAGTILDVLDNQTVEKITLSLPRGGVIVGRVSDEFGEPIAGAQVQAMRSRFMNGGRRLMPGGTSVMTDDLGAFRIYGLTPADYYVTASVRNMNMIGGPQTVTTAGMEGFATTYYPGTPDPSGAQRVVVRVAQETTGVIFALSSARLSTLRGRVASSTGEPQVQWMVQLMPGDGVFVGGMPGGMAQTRADGSFEMTGVAPGSYNLHAQPMRPPGEDSEVGFARVAVSGDDVDNLLIVTSRGGIARGTITTDEGIALPVSPLEVSLAARALEPQVTMIFTPPKVRDDWSFEMGGLFDRRIMSAAVRSGSEWLVKSIHLNGQDVTDTPVEFVAGTAVDGFQIVFTRKKTMISGGVSDDRGKPILDATVIAFADDPARWGFATRFVRTARPDQDGRFQVQGLPPAEYLLIAVAELEPGQFQDPAYLESLRAQAARVSLNEAETKIQDLKVVKQ